MPFPRQRSANGEVIMTTGLSLAFGANGL